MKQIIFISLILLSAFSLKAQTPAFADSSYRAYLTISRERLVEIDGLPVGATVDSLFFWQLGGRYFAREGWSSGVLSTRNAGIVANGSNGTYIMQKMVNSPNVKVIVLDDQLIDGTIALNSINFNGKLVRSTGNVRLVANGGTARTLTNLFIDMPRNAWVLDTLLAVPGLKTLSGKATPLNFGATGNGTTNDSRYMMHAINKTAAANIELDCYNQSFNLSNSIQPVVKNFNLKGGNIYFTSGGRFQMGFSRQDTIRMEDTYVELSGSNLNSAYVFDLRSQTGNKAQHVRFKNVTVDANGANYFILRGGNLKDVKIEGCRFYDSYSTAVMIDSSENIIVDKNIFGENGRAAVSIHSNNFDFKITNNTAIGGQLREDFNDGLVDVYGDNNVKGVISGNILDIGTARVNTQISARHMRIKGSFDIEVTGNIMTQNGNPYMYCFVEISNRNATRSKGVNFHDNIMEAKSGYYQQAIFLAGVHEWIVEDNIVRLDSANLTFGSSPRVILGTYAIDNTDSVKYASFRGNKFDLGNNAVRIYQTYAHVKTMDLSGTVARGMNQVVGLVSEMAIENLTWIGGSINSSSSSAPFQVTSGYKSVIVEGLQIFSPGVSYITRVSNPDASITSIGNMFNSEKAPPEGGGLEVTAVTTSLSTYTANDSVGLVYASGTGNQTINLSTIKGRRNAIFVVKKTGGTTVSNYARVVGLADADTVYRGSSGIYHFNGTTWTAISNKGVPALPADKIITSNSTGGLDTVNGIQYNKLTGDVGILRAPATNYGLDVYKRGRFVHNGIQLILRRMLSTSTLGMDFQDSTGLSRGIMSSADSSWTWTFNRVRLNANLGIQTIQRDNALLTIGSSNADRSQAYFWEGVDPTSPNNGDMWRTSTGLWYRHGGVNYNLTLAGTGGMSNPMTTALDLIVGGPSGAAQRFGGGGALNSIRINSAGTAWEWYTPSNTTYMGSTSIYLSGNAFQREAITGDAVAARNSNVFQVTGLLSNALPSLTPGYLYWNGSAWVFQTPSGGGGGSVDWADITSKPLTFAPSAHNHAATDITSGLLAPARWASGTPASNNVPFGDGTFKTVYTQSQVDAAIAAAIAALPTLTINSNVKTVVGSATTLVLDAGKYTPTVSGLSGTSNVYSPNTTLSYIKVADELDIAGQFFAENVTSNNDVIFSFTLPAGITYPSFYNVSGTATAHGGSGVTTPGGRIEGTLEGHIDGNKLTIIYRSTNTSDYHLIKFNARISK